MASGPVAITGASGFVGRRLVARLGEAGQDLRLLARSPDRLGDTPHEVVAGGLDDGAALDRLCAGADTVIHCAGAITALSRSGYEAVNVRGTAALAAAARRAGVRRFVLVSSLAAREPALSGYGASKLKGEEALKEAAGTHLSWVVLRPPAVYGPGDRGTLPLIQQLARQRPLIPGNAEARISLIYVDDLAAALHTLAGGGPEGSVHELHDGTPDGYSWAGLMREAGLAKGPQARCLFLPRGLLATLAPLSVAAGRLRGRAPMLTSGKVRELYHGDWVCRNALLEDYTDWRPRIRFAEGFARTLDWYRKAGWMT